MALPEEPPAGYPCHAARRGSPGGDLGVLLFGLAGLYSLLLALGGAASLLLQLSRSARVVEGRLQISAVFVTAAVDTTLRLAFGAALLGGRHRLARWLLGDNEPGGGRAREAASGRAPEATLGRAPEAALEVAAAGICGLAVLLIARTVTAFSYAISLPFLGGAAGDLLGMTAAGVIVDLLLALGGLLLVARRRPLAARLLALPPGQVGTGGDPGWQLPAMRFLGLALMVWYLPDLAAAAGVFVKWWLRPMGFDMRREALEKLPPAATGMAAGLYFLLLFPAGLAAVWRRLRGRQDRQGQRDRSAGAAGRE